MTAIWVVRNQNSFWFENIGAEMSWINEIKAEKSCEFPNKEIFKECRCKYPTLFSWISYWNRRHGNQFRLYESPGLRRSASRSGSRHACSYFYTICWVFGCQRWGMLFTADQRAMNARPPLLFWKSLLLLETYSENSLQSLKLLI